MKILITGIILSILSTSSYADLASYYGRGFHGKKTASGEVFNQYAMTAASNSHKMGTKLKVTNVATGKSVILVWFKAYNDSQVFVYFLL